MLGVPWFAWDADVNVIVFPHFFSCQLLQSKNWSQDAGGILSMV
jgi:hypothetical protein